LELDFDAAEVYARIATVTVCGKGLFLRMIGRSVPCIPSCLHLCATETPGSVFEGGLHSLRDIIFIAEIAE
jgi:hypothetical protein